MFMLRGFAFALSLAAVLLGSATVSAQLADKKALTLDAEKKIAAAAEAEAKKNNWRVVIAVLDDGGQLVYLQRIDETQIGSIEVAIGKARSAVLFKRPTKAFEDALVGGRMAILGVTGAVPLEGGLPLMADGRVIGAIGVSGVTSAQDGQVAKAGADALTTK